MFKIAVFCNITTATEQYSAEESEVPVQDEMDLCSLGEVVDTNQCNTTAEDKYVQYILTTVCMYSTFLFS